MARKKIIKNRIVMKWSKSIYISLTYIILVLVTSCNGGKTMHEEYHKFENVSWNRFHEVVFSTSFEDIQSEYDIYLNIRHLPEVPYKEMTINLSIFTPSGDIRTTDYTIRFTERDGTKISECLGDYCDLLVPLRESFRVYEAGVTRFEIENKYTKIEMPGIIEVGLIIKKSK